MLCTKICKSRSSSKSSYMSLENSAQEEEIVHNRSAPQGVSCSGCFGSKRNQEQTGGYPLTGSRLLDAEITAALSSQLQGDFEVHHVHTGVKIRSLALGPSFEWYIKGEDGGLFNAYYSWGGLSERLHSVLRTRPSNVPGVAYLVLGSTPSNEYFIKYTDGSYSWSPFLCPELNQVLEGDRLVERVHFGPVDKGKASGWYVKYEDGGATWYNLPSSLDEDLDAKWQVCGGVRSIAMGPSGQWFVLYNNGTYCCKGVHPSFARFLDQDEHIIDWVVFGPQGTYVAVCPDYVMCYAWPELTKAILEYQ